MNVLQSRQSVFDRRGAGSKVGRAARVDVGKHYELYERAIEKRKAMELLSENIRQIVNDANRG